MDGRRAAWVVGVTCCLVCCAPRANASEFGVAAPLLFYGPDGPDTTLEERALAAYNLQAETVGAVPRIRHVDSLVASLPDVEIVGTAEAQTCPGAPMSATTFVEEIDEAMQQVLYVQVEEATRSLDRLEALLPCLSGVLPRSEIGRISYLKGIVLAYAERPDEAREAFRRALVVSPELDWDPAFPPEPEQLFVQAIQDALRTPGAPLVVEPGLARFAELWVDSEPFASGGGTISLAEGRHVLQWRMAGGGFHTRVIAVEGGQQVTAFGRADVAAAALGGPSSEVVRQRAAEALGALVTSGEAADIYLAELGAVDLLHRFDHVTATWDLTDHGALTQRLKQRRRTEVGRGLLLAGGITSAVGAAVGLSGYAVAQQLYNGREDLMSAEEFDETSVEYGNARAQAAVGLAIAGIGSGVMLASIPFLERPGTAESPAKPNPIATLHVTATGLSLDGRF